MLSMIEKQRHLREIFLGAFATFIEQQNPLPSKQMEGGSAKYGMLKRLQLFALCTPLEL